MRHCKDPHLRSLQFPHMGSRPGPQLRDQRFRFNDGNVRNRGAEIAKFDRVGPETGEQLKFGWDRQTLFVSGLP